jgi:glucosylceramidase
MRGRLLAALVAGLTLVGAPAAAAAPKAHVWVTTPDGAQRMSDNGTVPFTRGGSDELTISVDPSRRYQRMDGFGASITDSSATLLAGLSPAVRRATMRDLFARNGLSFLRQPMGASDFVAGPHYTYDDVPAGRTDYRLRHFSIAHDRKQILPLLRRALALNSKLKVMGTPWSPPAWMKTNQSLVGGRLIDSPRIYDAYARYFVKFVRAYKRAGVPIYALTLQNEPQNRKPNAYPGMDMPVRQEAKLIEALGPKLQRAGLRTKLLGYDHTGKSTPTTSPRRRPARTPRRSTRPTCSRAAPAAGSPAPRSTATPATSSARPSSSIASRRRASGSPSAPARTARPIRLRRCSPTRSSGTRATSCSVSLATGARPS